MATLPANAAAIYQSHIRRGDVSKMPARIPLAIQSAEELPSSRVNLIDIQLHSAISAPNATSFATRVTALSVLADSCLVVESSGSIIPMWIQLYSRLGEP
jgi:hypothetical protein